MVGLIMIGPVKVAFWLHKRYFEGKASAQLQA